MKYRLKPKTVGIVASPAFDHRGLIEIFVSALSKDCTVITNQTTARAARVKSMSKNQIVDVCDLLVAFRVPIDRKSSGTDSACKKAVAQHKPMIVVTSEHELARCLEAIQ